MPLFKNKYRIGSKRLRGWDYSGAGWYYITICTQDHICYFGDVVGGKMKLSVMGEIVMDEWQKSAQVRPNIKLDAFVIMPNHLHGIIIVTKKINVPVETTRRVVSTYPQNSHNPTTLKPNSLGSIIGQFKSICTKRIWGAGYRNFEWQSRFYDSIVWDQQSLFRIRQYIMDNPRRWEFDRNNRDLHEEVLMNASLHRILPNRTTNHKIIG